MQRIPVIDARIRAIGYEAGALEIEYHRGEIDCYECVPEVIYALLRLSPSASKWRERHIKRRFPRRASSPL